MALTSGAKKFLGLIVVAGIVGGGIYYWKTMPKKAPEPIAVEQTEQAPQAVPQVVQDEQVQQAPMPAPAPVQQQAEPEENRGMAALLNAGKRQ